MLLRAKFDSTTREVLTVVRGAREMCPAPVETQRSYTRVPAHA
jgi:hypothetical protein